MKKTLLTTFTLATLAYSTVQAQNTIPATNTFPTTGKVGIGTTAPTSALQIADVADKDTPLLTIGDDTYFTDIDQGNILGLHGNFDKNVAGLQFGLNGNYIFGKGGNIGIGTNTPEYGLDVNGHIRAHHYIFMGTDLQMRRPDAINGTTYRRALVHGFNKDLIINYDSDFTGGVLINGPEVQIAGNLKLTSADKGILFYGGGEKIIGTPGHGIDFQTANGISRMTIHNSGQISIGNIPVSDPAKPSLANEYKLYVEKGIITEKIKVALQTTTEWSDYVFADTYKLRPLAAVESYIKANKHLPDVPSAQEMVNNGLDVAKTDAMLLQKIEELTLYMIELNKKVVALEKENASLKK